MQGRRLAGVSPASAGSLPLSRMHWEHEPEREIQSAAGAGALQNLAEVPPTVADAPASWSRRSCAAFHRSAHPEVHGKPGFLRMHWDHEPTPSPSKEGSDCGWPVPLPGGVRGGLICARFMESPPGLATVHRDHEPMRFGPRAVPARSGRAKTRAWVISLGCWRGPHAATGDRSRSATSLRPTHGPTAGSWKALPALMPCIGTMNLLSNDK